MRLVIIVIGILGILIFGFPGIVRRLVNVGSMTGLLVSALLTAYGIAFYQVNQWIAGVVGTKAGKCGVIICAILLSIIVLITAIATAKMVRAMCQQPTEDATLVVLGCRVYGDRASTMLWERIDAAEKYLKEHPNAKCIVSGGQGAGEDISEAECMARELIAAGIEKERIFLEDKSTSTRENIAFSQEIMEREHWKGSMAIVTNEFHEYRAQQVAKKRNLEVAAVNAHTAWWLFPTYYVRELYGIIYEAII